MIDLLNLERYSENPADYPLSLKKGDCYKRSFQVELARKLNANAERIEFLKLDIVTTPDRKLIEYKDIGQNYVQNVRHVTQEHNRSNLKLRYQLQ